MMEPFSESAAAAPVTLGAKWRVIEAWRLGQWGGAELKGCAGSVQKTGKEVKCTVTLKPPVPPGR